MAALSNLRDYIVKSYGVAKPFHKVV